MGTLNFSAAMTTKQINLYRFKWGQARKVLMELGGLSSSEAEAERHAIHAEALGRDKSSLDLTNEDFDKVLDALEDILVLAHGPRSGRRQDQQPARRLIFAIGKLGLDDAYLNAISDDQFRVADWRTLTGRDLICLRYTATARARARARARSKASRRPAAA
jgi:hypothetical protein